MSWSSGSAALLLLLGLGLGGCGFRPLYARPDTPGSVPASLAGIEVDEIKSRSGFMVRDRLLDLISPSGPPGQPHYKLTVTLNETESALGIQGNETVTSYDFHLDAHFFLREQPSNKVVFDGRARSIANYSVVTSQFATLSAQRDAADRASRALAEDIATRLSIWADEHRKQ